MKWKKTNWKKKAVDLGMGVVLAFAVVGLLTFGTWVYAQSTGLTTVWWHPVNLQGQSAGISYGTERPSTTNVGANPGSGLVSVLINNTTNAATLGMYDDNAGAWGTIAELGKAQTFASTQTFTAAATFNGSVALGNDEDDTVTINGAPLFLVYREDFEHPDFWSVDLTNADFTPSVADTEFNLYKFHNLDIFTRIQIAFAGTNTPETFLNVGIDTATDLTGKVFHVDHATILDVVDNDAIEYNFGGDPTESAFFYEDSDLSSYCEIGVRFDDISNISANDFYFGAFLAAAINDTFAYESSNTYATFSVLDTSGDLVIATDLNGGGTPLEDDSGTTIADNGTYVLRVEMNADTVAFYVDGTAVTQANAVLNADAGDEFTCRMGVRSAGTTKAGIELNYVEIGRAQ